MFRGCFKPKPKEMEIFFSVAETLPAVDVTAVDELPEPQPIPQKTIQTPIPEPPKPKKVEPPKPKKKEPPKPKWKPKSPDQIKKGRKISGPKKPQPPPLTPADIRKAFSGLKSDKGPSHVSPSKFNDYYREVYNRLYGAWKPPGTASSATRPAEVKIYMLKNGRITKRAKTVSSGDPLFDRTVMDAVNSISTLPKPPPDYPFNYVIVTFRIID